jgi:hypothetical protein
VQRCLVAVQVFDEGFDAALILEAVFLAGALVAQPMRTPEFRNDSSRNRLARTS